MRRSRLSRRHLFALLPLLGGLVVVGCGAPPSAALRRGLAARPARNEWPPAFWSASPEVQAAYRYAVEQPQLLEVIPCYCGCVEQGHASNKDCYILAFGANGQVTLDQHGFGCGGCVGVTQDVMRLQTEGRSPGAIRAAIDAKWHGALPATDTALPPA